MTTSGDFTKSVCDSLEITIKELRDIPHITEEKKNVLDQELAKLGDVLSKCTCESWTVREENLALQSLNDALVKTSSLVSEWKKRRIRLVLDKSTFVDELSAAVMEIQESCGKLQDRQNHREAARAIGEQLNTVVQGLRDGEPGNIAEAQFKKELLDFVRSNHYKSKTFEDAASVVTWLADYLKTDVDSIEQDLKEMKENADTRLNARRDTELLEQLILSLNELEKQSGTLASTKAKLICTLCGSQMICPVMRIDSGLSFCKACIELRFGCGSIACPETHSKVNKSFVVNVTLQNVVACFGEAEEQPAAELFTEDGESSDCQVADESLDMKAQLGLEYLDSSLTVSVIKGFDVLIDCASSPGGRPAVFNAKYSRPPPAAPAPPVKAIPTVIAKVQTDSMYSLRAVKLLARLTSSKGGASQNSGESDSGIILEDDALDFIVSLLNEEGFNKTRLLAAETLANILVNKEVRDFIRCKEGIVPSLVALSNANTEIENHEDRVKANTGGLMGLQHLAKCFKEGDKTEMIVSALIKLLKKGSSYPPELVRDSLVALDNQVLAMDHGTSTSEVCKMVWMERKELMKIKGVLVSHTSVPGRMAIINIMTKLCDLYAYKEGIDEHVFLYLLKMIKYTRSEIKGLPEPSSPSLLPQEGIETEKLKKNLTELVNRSVRLLCLCVKHGQSTGCTAQSALCKHDEEGRTLEELLLDGETLGLSDESRLEILSVLEQIDMLSTRAVIILVKISESKNQNCRQQVAKKLRKLVEGKEHLTEFIQAEGIAALLLLLKDPNLNCRQDALVALQAIPTSTAIPVDQLPLESILYFLIRKGPNDVTDAAIGLFDLMVKGKAISADKFLEFEGALEAILRLSDTDSDSLCSQKSASALLVMAKDDQSIRTRIAEHDLRGLVILVKYVRDLGNNKVKELLTSTLVLLCRDGEIYQRAVIEADGHRFLITSLQQKISKEEAARGLLKLIENTCTIQIVLDGGFVATALGSIDGTFVCKDIARGLDRISLIQEGLNQIYSESSSVPALLTLLKHCPDPSGKSAAALIISRLYPLLYRQKDSTRRDEITEKCQLLLDYLDPLETDHVKGFLQALAALAAERDGRKMIHHIHGHITLSGHLLETDTEIQDLVLKILSEMSSDISDNEDENLSAKRIRDAFMDIRVGISLKVFDLLSKDEFHMREESMKNALILIRNLSLAGSYASRQLVKEGAVKVLLEVLERHERISPIVTELALKALEKVLDDLKGKSELINEAGIRTLVAIVKSDVLGRAADAFKRASVAIIILIAVAQDLHNHRHAIETIVDGDILPALNKIIFEGKRGGKIKYNAVVLMKLLAMYGPSKVFVAIKEKHCLDALISLRGEPECKAMADAALNYITKKNKACKIYIQNRNLN